jgi:membrane-associated protease RseP (regulator of RpoE activity)
MAIAVALVSWLHGEDWAGAQQLIDPSPVEDEAESAADLPLPEHSLIVEKPSRDNSRAYFGVTFDPLVPSAAVARSVSAGSPADEAGVHAGDTIVSLNGQRIGKPDDVLRTIASLKPGDVLDVEVSRRVVVRARAVLDGAPVGVEHTTGYRAEAEALPPPAGYESQPPALGAPTNRAPANRAPANVNAPRPQRNATPPNRNTNANRDERSNRTDNSNDRDRGYLFRGGFFRRGR